MRQMRKYLVYDAGDVFETDSLPRAIEKAKALAKECDNTDFVVAKTIGVASVGEPSFETLYIDGK